MSLARRGQGRRGQGRDLRHGIKEQRGQSLCCTQVALGELHLTQGPGHALSVDGLGSCVALLGYQAGRWLAAHVVLPGGPNPCPEQPVYAAQQLRAALLAMSEREAWALKDTRFALIGGGRVLHALETQDIGARNISAVRYVLSQLGAGLGVERVGGERSRRVWVAAGSPELHLSSQDVGWMG